MSGEMRLVRGALRWGALVAVPVAGISWLVRGSEGAYAALIALGIVLANALAAAGASALAAKVSRTAPMMISIPSFAVRMGAIFAGLAILKQVSFIDHPTFALTFGLGVFAIIALESMNWKRTPWVALTFNPVKEQP